MLSVACRMCRSLPAVVLLVIGGCGSTAASRFYMLTPVAEGGTERGIEELERYVLLGLGPVELPQYLDRPQIVSRADGHRITLAEFDRWAEQLEDNLLSVLAQNVNARLAGEEIAVIPWRRGAETAYQVSVGVVRFDGTPGGEAVLCARWAVAAQGSAKLLALRRACFRESVRGHDYASLVEAESRLAGQLGDRIAESIKASIGR